ncbi:MAG TPA: hypothetical protein VNV38_03010 [Stellaceae bacterium]|jgi:hypothetical protein|nr:hypothetical protein [Stellaceae bacterium]
METMTFTGTTLEEAEERKAEWLSANPGVIVRASRAAYLAEGTGPHARPEYRHVIDLDYDYSN